MFVFERTGRKLIGTLGVTFLGDPKVKPSLATATGCFSHIPRYHPNISLGTC